MILDATAGGRMMWFDKNPDDVLFVDKRVVPPGAIVQQPLWNCQPDIQADNTRLPFADNTFEMVVFDPPHVKFTPASLMGVKYGVLTDLHEVVAGLEECARVASNWLVFKWAENESSISEVLAITHLTPLFGHTTASSGKTIWCVFDVRR